MSRGLKRLPGCDEDAVVKVVPCTSLHMNSHCGVQLGLLEHRSRQSVLHTGHAHCKSTAPEDMSSPFTENLALDVEEVLELLSGGQRFSECTES